MVARRVAVARAWRGRGRLRLLRWRRRRAFGGGAVGGAEKRGGDIAHLVEFAFGKRVGLFAGLGKEDELAEVAEGSGAARGDAVGGKGFEDALEGAMHVEAGIRAGKIDTEFGGKIFFDGSAAAVELGVGAAEIAVGGGHGALASIRKFKMAKVARIVLSSHGHGERIAKKYYIVNILL